MLIPMKFISRLIGADPVSVLHVGAHTGEEWGTYCAQGWGPRVWIEALPELADRLARRFEGSEADAVLKGAAWSVSGLSLEIHRASNGQSSSLLDPTGHLSSHPDVSFKGTELVTTVTLDEAVGLMRSRFGVVPTFLNLDIQGAELEALKGLSEWTSVSWLYTEVSIRELYGGQALIGDLDQFLQSRGFRRVATRIHSNLGWGEALYARSAAWRERPLLVRFHFLLLMRALAVLTRTAAIRSAIVDSFIRD